MVNRNTVRRNFSITKRADMALEEMSDEWDMSRSEIVSKAVLEYTDRDRTARIEEKLDDVLHRLDAPKTDGGTLSQNTAEKEKVSPASDTHTFDPADYDPDADRGPLSKDELKDLVRSVDEPVINPDHVDDETLSTNNPPKIKAIAGIIRYEKHHEPDNFTKIHPLEIKERYLPEYWGSPNEKYYLKFADPILDEFHQAKYIEAGDDGESFTVSAAQYYVAEADRKAEYQEMVDGIREVVDQPVYALSRDTTPLTTPSYAKLKKWLARNRSYLTDYGIASEDEIDSLIDQLDDRIDEIDDLFDLIREEFCSYEGGTAKFQKEELVEVLPYDEYEAESFFETLDTGELVDYDRLSEKWVLVEDNIIRPD